MKENRLAQNNEILHKTWQFNEYLIIMSKNFPIPKCNHRRSASTEFQMGCFPVTY
ncbi:hypothetical protein T01_7173 [Trichinella spiralis]|uniref:Uncharacterized protein n=1 Tax=Trichinella spiralis TaxID=6334 RepID=A0A0V0Z2Y1_TRISP|nr:hypothetical protein T01_7173 [Trichinella spiralis]